ncbi:MAG: sigma-70 family RNA polymerase sigma factor [Eubacteriales bacterium]
MKADEGQGARVLSAPDTRQNDSALAARAAQGDDAAFEEIVNRYSRLIYNIVLRSCASSEDAADIAQETFLKAWRSLSSFRGECALSTWLCRIALNCACDHARSSKRHLSVSLTVPDEEDENRILDIPDTDVTSMPEEELTRKTEIEAVREAISSLTEDQRIVVTMRDISGLSYAEIAETLHLEMGTVKSRINRARAAIKTFLLERNFFT